MESEISEEQAAVEGDDFEHRPRHSQPRTTGLHQKRRRAKSRRNVVTIGLESDWKPEAIRAEREVAQEEHNVRSTDLSIISATHKKMRAAEGQTVASEPFIKDGEAADKDRKTSGKRPSYMGDHRGRGSKSNKKWIRLATVLAYVVAVSLAAVALAIYYTFFWHPGNLGRPVAISIRPLLSSESDETPSAPTTSTLNLSSRAPHSQPSVEVQASDANNHPSTPKRP